MTQKGVHYAGGIDQCAVGFCGQRGSLRAVVEGRHGAHHEARGIHQRHVSPSIKPGSRFNYINVAIRKNETLYWKAYGSPVTPTKETLGQLGVEITRALPRRLRILIDLQPIQSPLMCSKNISTEWKISACIETRDSLT